MKIQDIRKIASEKGLKAGKLDKPQLIRHIQKTEANSECFATPYVRECGQMNCLWRDDCSKAV